MRRFACGFLLLAVALGGCGGGDATDDPSADDPSTDQGTAEGTAEGTAGGGAPAGPADAAAYADAVAAATSGTGIAVDDQQNRCFARSFVDVVGVDALTAEATPEQIENDPAYAPDVLGLTLTPEQTDAFYAGLQGCGDVRSLVLDGFGSGAELTEADMTCISGALTDEGVRTMMVAAYVGAEPADGGPPAYAGVISDLMAACPEAMAAAGW
ncbi:MAG TPA: hypothetical protein VFI47_17970 [Acidimicrobiales bacterium]|nr:hypothetical protein [Acidimicrobiales bacterium]